MEKDSLLDWNIDETKIYLELAHGISDYKVQNKIYRVTGGYPIITYFISEDYKLKHVLDIEQPIVGVNEYYDTLFTDKDRPSAAIGVFATGNCFFTWKELETFFSDPEMFEVICHFIDLHPYLFKKQMNRISLIHDSFNTYLKMRIQTFSQRRDKTLAIIRNSILNGSIEYMARMESFDFDKEFYQILLKKYSDFNEFKNLILSTRDYNSIQSLYMQLRAVLEDEKGLLDIYQYYSFILLFQIACRNDLIGNDSLVFQMLLYMKNHGEIEDNIFSSDYIWQVYLTCKNSEKYTVRYLANRHFSENQFYELIENINDNCTFFEKKDKVVTYDELEKQLCDKEHRMLDKDKFLADYLISVWLHGNKEDKFYDSFEEYIMHGNQRCISGMLIELSKYEFDKFWIERSLSTAEYQLHELGYFEEKNKFRNISLMDLIMKGAADGSYNVVTLAASYLKLANYEKREVDINNLAYSWIMYFEHKDYSVYAIDEALFVFEKQKLIREEESFAMIQRLMAQSDDGISHLLTSYVNKKGVQYVRKVNGTGYFKERSCRIRFWELAPEIYDCFDRKDMDWQITELLRDHYQSKFIEWR